MIKLDTPFFVFSYKTTNFGDCLTRVFFEKISNKEVTISKNRDQVHYLSVGSIIGKSTINSIIMGAGAMENYTEISDVKEVLWVRGPLTRNNLLRSNINCPENYGDPFILFPLIYNKSRYSIKFDLGFIPHTNDKNTDKYNSLVKKLSINNTILEIDINI
jgi:pyruvyltransferase